MADPAAAPDLDWDDPRVRRRLAVLVQYEGPFERLMNWLWCLDPVTNEIWREVLQGSLRNWLACRAESADRAWRQHYVRSRRCPPERWRRRGQAFSGTV